MEVISDSRPVTLEYSGFFQRVIAYIIDRLIVGMIAGFLFAPFIGLLGISALSWHRFCPTYHSFSGSGGWFLSLLAFGAFGSLADCGAGAELDLFCRIGIVAAPGHSRQNDHEYSCDEHRRKPHHFLKCYRKIFRKDTFGYGFHAWLYHGCIHTEAPGAARCAGGNTGGEELAVRNSLAFFTFSSRIQTSEPIL